MRCIFPKRAIHHTHTHTHGAAPWSHALDYGNDALVVWNVHSKTNNAINGSFFLDV